MIHPIKTLPILLLMTMMISCSGKEDADSTSKNVPTASKEGLWLNYTNNATEFRIWSPGAEQVKVNLYDKGDGGPLKGSHMMTMDSEGIWSCVVGGDLNGVYYTYQILIDNNWMDETPGIYARAVGVNGKRAMVLNLDSTDPDGWNEDRGPELSFPNEAIIYELHIRDMTSQPESGSSMPGTYLGLVEKGTRGPGGISTGMDHITALGVNYVHLLPAFDHYSINEQKLDSAQFNWGYEPQNYNVPEGSFSSDPYRAEVRIREFKQMVKAFHDNGIGVILDVVYNHTGRTESSGFNLEYPDYYYRFRQDGSLSDASACGNETASDKEMMRKFMIESVCYWAREYHLDGFRFDLMGVHDIQTMNELTAALKEVNPHIIVYGEGWTAGDSPLPERERALKKHVKRMPQLSAFSDDIRDGLKGSVFEDMSTGFVSGAAQMEESVKFGIVGSIDHPGIDYTKVNYSDAAWANDPWQAISYVSCHDNHTLYDKLTVSRPEADLSKLIAMDQLANAVVLTSQGTAFIHAGAELLRTKNEEHNSYNLPDSINQIDWNWKIRNKNVFDYYKNLISLRKAHPAFRMPTGDMVRANLSFKRVENGLISYQLSDHANRDPWKNILVIYNAKQTPVEYALDGSWRVAVRGNSFDLDEGVKVSGSVQVPAISMLLAFQ